MAECPLAKRIPNVHRCGDEVEDLRRQGMKEDLAALLNFLWNCPERIHDTLAFAKRMGKVVSADSWPDTPPNMISQVPSEGIAKFFAQHGVVGAYLDEANVRDDSLLGQLFALALHVPPSLGLPQLAKENAAAFWRWARSRANEVGRIKLITDNLTADAYDKMNGGAYVITWDKAGKATQVEHTATGDKSVMEAGWTITRQWAMQQWHNDMAAVISHSQVLKLTLSQCFKPNRGPCKLMMTKGQWEKVIDRHASADPNAEKPPTEIDDIGEDIMVKSRLAKQASQAARAKDNLAKHRAAKLTENTIQLGTS